jgi:hypothetical protein
MKPAIKATKSKHNAIEEERKTAQLYRQLDALLGVNKIAVLFPLGRQCDFSFDDVIVVRRGTDP